MCKNQEYFKNILPKRPSDSNKGTFGHVLNIAGSGNYSGAAYFSSVAPLRVGCGRVTLASGVRVLSSVSAQLPDIILRELPVNRYSCINKSGLKFIKNHFSEYNSVSIGCGLSVDKDSENFLEGFVDFYSSKEIPVVIDADGLNLLAKIAKRKKVMLGQNFILTPHPLEMSRLVRASVDDILSQPEFWARHLSEKFDCTCILKIHRTIVVDNSGKIYENFTGNTALSKAGSGDILCGMITGFLAQGLSAFDASCLSVYLHGRAAELASEELTEYGSISSDIVKYYIPRAIKYLLKD